MKDRIVQDIEAEIDRLTQVRDLLIGSTRRQSRTVRAGTRHRRPMSVATKAKIAERMRERWAERKKK